MLIIEIMGDKLKEAPSFEHIVQELDWRAVFFYIALFALVGGLEKTHILDMMANWLRPMFAQNYALGATILYWVTIPIVGIVEHDAYILTFLNTIKELGTQGVAAVAAVVGGAVGRHARLQSHGRRRARALRGAAHRREGGGPQGFAARVPVLEHAVHSGQFGDLLRVRDADLGPAVREMMKEHSMFKNILIPTDGSALSQKAATQGVALAKALGARVTAFFAAPPATPVVYRDNLPVGLAQPGEHAKMIERTAAKYLDFVERCGE